MNPITNRVLYQENLDSLEDVTVQLSEAAAELTLPSWSGSVSDESEYDGVANLANEGSGLAAEVERLSDEYQYWLREAEAHPEHAVDIAMDLLDSAGYDAELTPRRDTDAPRIMPSDVGYDPSV